MTTPAMRPPFDLLVSVSPEEALGRIQTWSSDPECACGIMTTASQVDVLVPESRRHVWSPWLSLKAEAVEGGTRLRGRFAPHPSIWTLFMSAYAFMAFIFLMGACWGTAQVILDQPAWALWGMPGAVLGGVALFIGSRVGQRLGYEQMCDLRHCVGALFEDAEVDTHTRAPSAADRSPDEPSTPPGASPERL